MNTKIFEEYPKLIDYVCRRYGLEHYNSKILKTNLRLNLELLTSKLEKQKDKEHYPTHVFKIKD